VIALCRGEGVVVAVAQDWTISGALSRRIQDTETRRNGSDPGSEMYLIPSPNCFLRSAVEEKVVTSRDTSLLSVTSREFLYHLPC
jgi:hypothetical protein